MVGRNAPQRPNPGRPYRDPPIRREPPRSHYPAETYPDVWKAEDDERHNTRVELFKMRRDTIAVSRSGSTTPQDPTKKKDWRDRAPWNINRKRGSSRASPAANSSGGMSPVELRSELDRYEEERQLLTDQEWPSPPSSRSQVRRLTPKEYNDERIKTLKRWSQVEGIMYGLNSSTLRESDIRHPREVYVPGLIFSAPLHTPASSDEMYVQYDDPNLTATPFGTIHSKYRKMIVLRVFGEHVQCSPIYTHNGRGLEGKDFPQEFVSIRDIEDRSPAPEEGPHTGLHARRNESYKGTFIGGKTAVKLTEVYSHRYDAPATLEGSLEESTGSLRRLFELIGVMGA